MLDIKGAEIQIKLQSIASIFAEYLDYYKPYYELAIDLESKKMCRAKRRDFLRNANKAMNETVKMAHRFSKLMENTAPAAHNDMIDYLHEAINKIQFTHTKDEDSSDGNKS